MSDPKKPVPVGRGIRNKLNQNAGLKITSVRDGFDNEYMGAQKKIEQLTPLFKGAELLIIRFKVVSTQTISLWIEFEPSDIHEKFYEDYRTKTFLPPRVALLIDSTLYLSGEHEIKWDGRDQTPDRRLLLAGKYKVKIEGSGIVKPKDETLIEIDVPSADLYGIHYKLGRRWESTKKEVAAGVKALKELGDGSRYSAFSWFDATAESLGTTFSETAVSYLSGHSGPLNFNLHSEEGVKFSKKNKTVLIAYGDREPPSLSMESVSDGTFADMLLVMFNGCRPANELYIFQLLLNRCFPGGVDYKHGKKTTAGLKFYQDIVGLTPGDGTKNDPTLAWFGIDKTMVSEREQTAMLQRKLRSYYCGKEDGKWGKKTEKALRNFQRDHPKLSETGVLDDPTRIAMAHFKDYNKHGRNIAESVMTKGTDLAFGFEHKVGFKDAENWAIRFFETVATGKGLMSSANDATANLDVRKRKQFAFNIYAQKGINKDSPLQPARFGRFAK